MRVILLLTGLMLFFTVSGLEAQGQNASDSFKLSNTKNAPIITEQEKEQIRRDTRKLIEDFKAAFRNLSYLGLKVSGHFIEYVSAWIDENYKKLSEVQRQKLRDFANEMKLKLKDIEHLSGEKLSELLVELEAFLESLKTQEQTVVPEENNVI